MHFVFLQFNYDKAEVLLPILDQCQLKHAPSNFFCLPLATVSRLWVLFSHAIYKSEVKPMLPKNIVAITLTFANHLLAWMMLQLPIYSWCRMQEQGFWWTLNTENISPQSWPDNIVLYFWSFNSLSCIKIPQVPPMTQMYVFLMFLFI